MLTTPQPGLIIWAGLIFLIFLFLLRKFAWKPILNAVKNRENRIDDSLRKAEKAKRDLENLETKNQELLKETRAERDEILKEARQLKEQTIAESKSKASEEAAKIIQKAKEDIEQEKVQAQNEIKKLVSSLSVEIAEKILQKNLDDKTRQQTYVNDLLKNMDVN